MINCSKAFEKSSPKASLTLTEKNFYPDSSTLMGLGFYSQAPIAYFEAFPNLKILHTHYMWLINNKRPTEQISYDLQLKPPPLPLSPTLPTTGAYAVRAVVVGGDEASPDQLRHGVLLKSRRVLLGQVHQDRVDRLRTDDLAARVDL